MTAWEEIDDFLATHDAVLKLDVATHCMWGGSLTVITEHNDHGTPDVSVCFWAGGYVEPEDVVRMLLTAAKKRFAN